LGESFHQITDNSHQDRSSSFTPCHHKGILRR
jgi:hypothetical protein